MAVATGIVPVGGEATVGVGDDCGGPHPPAVEVVCISPPKVLLVGEQALGMF